VKRSTLGDRINRCGLGRQPETAQAISRPAPETTSDTSELVSR
jgi:hypothetical protein